MQDRDEVGLHGHPSLLPREVKEIHKYGIAFWDKECRVVVKYGYTASLCRFRGKEAVRQGEDGQRRLPDFMEAVCG